MKDIISEQRRRMIWDELSLCEGRIHYLKSFVQNEMPITIEMVDDFENGIEELVDFLHEIDKKFYVD